MRTDPALRRLVLLEFRRVAPVFRRGVVVFAVIAAGLWLLGWSSPGRAAFLLTLISASMLVQWPANTLRDKVEGGLEFLISLPVDAATLVQARFLSIGLAAVPVAVAFTASLWMGAPALVDVLPEGVWPFGVFLFWMVALGVGTALTVGLVLRLRLNQAGYLPMVFFVAAIAGGEAFDRAYPDPLVAVRALVAWPWFSGVLWTVVLVGSAALGWTAYRLACDGIQHYVPGRDEVTW